MELSSAPCYHQNDYPSEAGRRLLALTSKSISLLAKPRIGLLALQGGFERHEQLFRSLGITTQYVKKQEDLRSCDGLVLPGGESGSMLRLISYLGGFWDALRDFCQDKPTWGTCAGSILLAKEVTHPQQASLKIIGIQAQRNAYGRQKESRALALDWLSPELGKAPPFTAIFIRAPKLIPLPGERVDVLAKLGEEPVALRSGRCMVSSFHPELGEDPRFHQYFLEMFE